MLNSPDNWFPSTQEVCRALVPPFLQAAVSAPEPSGSSDASNTSSIPPPSPGSGLEPPPPVKSDERNPTPEPKPIPALRPVPPPIQVYDTPSAPSTVPMPITKFDSILDSPEPWPPAWRQICRVLFPVSPVRRIVFPPARPLIGSIDSVPSPMSDSGSESSPSAEPCQTFAPLRRLTNTPTENTSIPPEARNESSSCPRVFYHPDETRPAEIFIPRSMMKNSPKNDQTASGAALARDFAAISQVSGLPLAKLENAKTLKDVVRVLTEAMREVSLRQYSDSEDSGIPPEKSRESESGTTKETLSVPSSNTFSFDAKAFMSYGMILNPEKRRTVQDDLESLTWIFFYIVLRYTKHNAVIEAELSLEKPTASDSPHTPVRTKTINKPNLHSLMTLLFCDMAEEEYGTGFAKVALFLAHAPIRHDFEVFDNPPITAAVFSLIELFKDQYNFFEHSAPKRIRALAIERDISYEEAKILYKDTNSYKRHMEKINLIPQKMEAVFDKCLNEVGWPAEHKLVDGLAPTGLN